MKKDIQSILGPEYEIKKVRFKDYNFEITKDGITYYVMNLGISSRNILTINSKHIWSIKSGKVSGVQFKTTSHRLISIKDFNRYPNRIIILKSKPYKILKYINESDIVDISTERIIHDTIVISDLHQLKQLI